MDSEPISEPNRSSPKRRKVILEDSDIADDSSLPQVDCSEPNLEDGDHADDSSLPEVDRSEPETNRCSSQASEHLVKPQDTDSEASAQPDRSSLERRNKVVEDASSADDLSMSDFSEPETKLRQKCSTRMSEKFARLREARKATSQTRRHKKKLHSRRIVPDSEDDPESKSEQAATSVDEGEVGDVSDEDGDDLGVESEEEERRLLEEFVVDDMATTAEADRVRDEMAELMPSAFRLTDSDYLAHFKIVCRYLVYRFLIPHVDWLQRSSIYKESFEKFTALVQSKITLVDSAAWRVPFRKDLRRRPMVERQYLEACVSGCDACHNVAKNSYCKLIFKGLDYNPVTLEDLPSDDTSSESSIDSEAPTSRPSRWQKKYLKGLSHHFTCGPDCASRALAYHYLKHWQRMVFDELKREMLVMDPLDPEPSGPEMSDQHIENLKEQVEPQLVLLESTSFLDSLYNNIIDRLGKIHKAYATD